MNVVVRGKRGAMRPDSLHVVRGQQTRRRILDAARARILAHGFEALRLDDLARDAGVTKAAVIKSAGGKASILLLLGDEDRLTRIALIRQAIALRTGLPRRLADLTRALCELDLRRLNVVMAYIGYMWFWTGADHDRAHEMVEETRDLLAELIATAAPVRPSEERLRNLSRRVLGGYVIALRDLCYERATLDDAVRFVVEFVLAPSPVPATARRSRTR
jgi:AcrR family transcriptional regulator